MPVWARRRAPAGDRAVGAAPHLRPLRLVLVPGARVEDADLLIQNLIQLGEELDHLLIGIAMIDRHVVPRAVAQRPPDDRNAILRKHVTAVLQMREVAQLERKVVQVGVLAPHEVDGVVIGVAAHEHEDVLDPVRDAEAEDALIEIRDRVDVRHHEGDVAELERRDAGHGLAGREIAPFREQLDLRALDVLEGEKPGHAWNIVAALFALDALRVRKRLISAKSDCGVTWNASLAQRGRSPRLSCSTSWPTLVVSSARSFSRAATTRPVTLV